MRTIVANWERKHFSVACSPPISSYRINSRLEDCLIIKGIGRNHLESNHLLCIGIQIKVFEIDGCQVSALNHPVKDVHISGYLVSLLNGIIFLPQLSLHHQLFILMTPFPVCLNIVCWDENRTKELGLFCYSWSFPSSLWVSLYVRWSHLYPFVNIHK